MSTTRRDVALVSAGVGAAVATGVPLLAQSPAPRWKYLTAAEGAFVAAAADRIIPPDEHGPGGKDAGVAEFIDGQLAGPWGQGAQFYAAGPHQPGTPQQGYQGALTPAAMYRAAIPAIDRAAGGRGFAALPPDRQDAMLADVGDNKVDLGPIDGRTFFLLLRNNCVEGYFADPLHGGNRDMAGWKLLGFPGAYAAYWFEVEDHGFPYARPPASIEMVQEACRTLPGQPGAEAARAQQPQPTSTSARGRR